MPSGFKAISGIEITNPANVEYYAGPWLGTTLNAALSNAKANVTSQYRYHGMKISLLVISNTSYTLPVPPLYSRADVALLGTTTSYTYWFKDGIGDNDLVPFAPDKDAGVLGAAAGSTEEIQFNKNGVLSGSKGLLFRNSGLNNPDAQLVVRRNLSSPTAPPNDGSRLWVEGTITATGDINAGIITGGVVKAPSGFSGSLTQLTDGSSYLIQGTGISISSGTNGAVTISSNAVTSPAGASTQIQFNNNNAFGANPNLTFDTSTNTLATQNVSLAGNLSFNTVGAQSITHLGSAFQNLSISSTNAAVNVEGTYFDNNRVHMFGDLTASADINLAKSGHQIIRKSDVGNLSIFSENGTVLIEGTVFNAYDVGINGPLYSTSDINLTREGDQKIIKNTDAGVFAITSSKGPITINGNTFSANDIYPTSAGSSVNLMNQGATTLKIGAGATTGGITIGSNDTITSTPVNIGGGTGKISIGTQNAAKTIEIGTAGNGPITLGNTSISGGNSVKIDSGTGNIDIGTGSQARSVNLGTGAATQTVTIGSTTDASSLKLQSGTGDITIDSIDNVTIGRQVPGYGVINVPNIGLNSGVKLTFGSSTNLAEYGEMGHYENGFTIKTKTGRDLVITSFNGASNSRMMVLSSSQGSANNGSLFIAGGLVVGMDSSSAGTGMSADINTKKTTLNLGNDSTGNPNLLTINVGKTGVTTNLKGTVSMATPSISTSNTQILTRNLTNGNIEYTNATSISDEINLGVIYALSTYNYVP